MKANGREPQWFCSYCGAWSSGPYCRDCRSDRSMRRRDERCVKTKKHT